MPVHTLWVGADKRESNWFGVFLNDPKPAAAAGFERRACTLSLRPFNFWEGAEDEWFNRGGRYNRGIQLEDGSWMGPASGNANNLTNPEEWAAWEVADFLNAAHFAIFYYFPKVTELFIVVPENLRLTRCLGGHYEFNNTAYPITREKGLLPWTEAGPRALIYDTKVLKLIERQIHRWMMDEDVDGNKPEKPKECVWPQVKLVIADYDGRRA